MRREAHVSAGSVVHLGDVRVEPAKGCIVIIVEDWPETEPAKQVRVSLSCAWSRRVPFPDEIPRGVISGGRYEFRNMALGRQLSLLFFVEGESQSAHIVNGVTATAEQPVQEIRLKMKDLFK
ncbi:MAG: hypothetical protein IT463_11750 [Planctomycetes bacterium]|nr:hypothetical protein [Planctomycetota bacterium]